MRAKDTFGTERKCPICHKVFIKHDGWVYERKIASKTRSYCSWGCLRQWEITHGTKIDRRDKIIQAIHDGLSNREIASLLEEDMTKINYWRKKLENEESFEERAKGKDKDAGAESSGFGE